jgi:hypothetical protein
MYFIKNEKFTKKTIAHYIILFSLTEPHATCDVNIITLTAFVLM